MVILPVVIKDLLLLGIDLYQHRFDWEATTTFYYHWKWGDYVFYRSSPTPYTWHGAYTSYSSLEDYQAAMAVMYPDLINNAQFIYCSQADDPNALLSGRPPVFRKLEIGLPYFNRPYRLQHFYGYNQPYNGFDINADIVYTFELHWWKKAFIHNHKHMGKYFDYVHELHDTFENREIVNERPSKHMYNPKTIHKAPNEEYKSPLYSGLSLLFVCCYGLVKCWVGV